jgi:hypothetical protein
VVPVGTHIADVQVEVHLGRSVDAQHGATHNQP